MNNSFVVVIPARYGSNRLPGKPLLEIASKPMIAHVLENARKSQAREIIVATDDERIVEVVQDHAGKAVLTNKAHASGSDRIAEVAQKHAFTDDTVIVNVQGDEPQMPYTLIDQVAVLLMRKEKAKMATLCTPIHSQQEMLDGAAVKVVRDSYDYALYFSRAPIPWQRQAENSDITSDAYRQAMRHIGIYAYTSGYIRHFSGLPQSSLEQIEKLEQLRALSNGDYIACEQALIAPVAGIDTQEDLDRVRREWLQAD